MTLQEFKPAYFTLDICDGIVVAKVTQTRLCEEDNIEQFGVELNQAIESHGSCRLVLDLANVTVITSSAIGKMIGLHRNLHRREGMLVMCGVSTGVHNVLATAKLNDYFHITPATEAAMKFIKSQDAIQESITGVKPR